MAGALEDVRRRLEEVRAQGVIPRARQRVEEVSERVRGRAGGKLTREGGGGTSPSGTKRTPRRRGI